MPNYYENKLDSKLNYYVLSNFETALNKKKVFYYACVHLLIARLNIFMFWLIKVHCCIQ